MSQSSGQPKLAIITRTKDRPLFLKRAIESVESQTYDDYVHVIFNDGGDKKKLEELVGGYGNPRRKVIHSPKHIGLVRALNQAIKAVDSKYVTILDDDDSWPPERLEKTVNYLEESEDKAVVVRMDIIIEKLEKDQIVFVSQHPHPESSEGQISLFKQCYANYVSNGIVTYRRDVYDELKGYDETLPTAEDWDFGLRLLLKYDVALLDSDKPLFYYHQRPRQKGMAGNSVHAGVLDQQKAQNALRNYYLRKELAEGKLGVGYIMNLILHDRAIDTHLERHMNYIEGLLEAKIEHVGERVASQVDELMPMRIEEAIIKLDYVSRARSKIKKIIRREK